MEVEERAEGGATVPSGDRARAAGGMHLAGFAVLLALATAAGLHVGRGAPAGALVLGGLLALARATHRIPTWALVGLVLALARAASLPGPRTFDAPGDGALARARDAPIVGRWRSLGSGRGYVDACGIERRSASDAAAELGHRLVLDVPLAPPDGTWTAILPGGFVVPYPEGPAPGPARRDGRFVGTSVVHPDELVALAPPPDAGALARLTRDARRWIGARADVLESGGPGRGLVRALLLGDRSGVAPETLDLFTRTGTRHLLALSGLHVGLVASLLLLPATGLLALLPFARARSRERRARMVAALRLLLLAAFVVVVGAGEPVTRAAIALAFGLLGPLVREDAADALDGGRRVDALALWGLALVLELVIEPRSVESLALRLSYLATLGILVGCAPIAAGLRRAFAFEPAVVVAPSVPRLVARVARQRCGRFLATAIGASVAAMLATLPEVAARFGEVSPIGALATPLVLPLVTLLLVGAWCGVLAAGVLATPMLGVFAEATARVADALVRVLVFFDAVPGTPFVVPPRPAWLAWTMVVLAFVALRSSQRNERPSGWARRSALSCACAWLVPWSAHPSGLEIHALDVGHGTSVVVRAPGLPALVFDAGSRDRRRLCEEAIAPLLAAWEVDRPFVVLSHDHADHRSALPRLVERFEPALFGGALPTDLGERLPHDASRIDVERGRVVILERGPLRVALFRGAGGSGNEGSRSLEIGWRGETFLLCGDAEDEGLAAWIADPGVRGETALLLAPHHGSDTRLLAPLLERAAPRRVWISGSRPPAIGPELDRRELVWDSTARSGPLSIRAP